ncbi:MAG TPA: Bax inhibitor-1/YccA family protein [Acidimicrobiia bacterium]|nr:Bax inhibitor-1/YccA family protein [Acidimicrobiia bacterium]
MNVLLDFAVIENGSRNGAPRAYCWFAAFGLMVTIIWLYIEILRLLANVFVRRQ